MTKSPAQQDAEALALIGDIAWDALKDTTIPQGQIAEATGAIIGVLGEAYLKDRARYLVVPREPEVPPGPT